MKNKFHWEEIRKLAIAHQMEEPTSSSDALLRFLRFWWSKNYNRPLKDPLLMSYTADELTYEFLRYFYSIPENDPKKKIEEEEAAKDDEAWVAKMLATNVQKEQTDTSEVGRSKEKTENGAEPPQPVDLPEISTKFDPNI